MKMPTDILYEHSVELPLVGTALPESEFTAVIADLIQWMKANGWVVLYPDRLAPPEVMHAQRNLKELS